MDFTHEELKIIQALVEYDTVGRDKKMAKSLKKPEEIRANKEAISQNKAILKKITALLKK